jgi:hypothetical protein
MIEDVKVGVGGIYVRSTHKDSTHSEFRAWFWYSTLNALPCQLSPFCLLTRHSIHPFLCAVSVSRGHVYVVVCKEKHTSTRQSSLLGSKGKGVMVRRTEYEACGVFT